MYEFFRDLDRRWIFLLMLVSVVVPIIIIGLTNKTLPEVATPLAQATFDKIEALEPGDKVLMAWDFDPGSEGELGPMATAFTRHCCEKGLKMYFMTLWPVGTQMVDDYSVNKVIRPDFPDLVYGEDYIRLGYKSGYEGVIKVIVTDLKQLYTTDHFGNPISNAPMMQDVESVQDMDLIINVSAGYAGTKEWVQYAVTPFPNSIELVAGCTGVQAPLLYPYIPEQLPGLLGAIKGAAEYEALVLGKYNEPGTTPHPRYLEGQRRMGPQLVAHLLMIILIIAGNLIYFVERRKERRR